MLTRGGGDDNNFALARFNSDGPADLTFGAGGRVATQLKPPSGSAQCRHQDDGRIVVAGSPTFGERAPPHWLAVNPTDRPMQRSARTDGWTSL